MTSFNTGATADSGSSQTASQAITIPAGVLAGDEVLFVATVVPISSSTGTVTVASTGTTPAQVGPAQNQSVPATPATVTVTLWKMVAGSSDAGKVVTFTSTVNGFWSVSLGAWSGTAGASAIDVSGGTISAAAASTVTCPSLTTGVSGDWAIYLTGGSYELGTLAGPSGSTQREKNISAVSVSSAIFDSNASVGGSGTGIGGGIFDAGGTNTNNMLAAFTVGLAPAGSGTAHTATASLTVTPARAAFPLGVHKSGSSGGVDTYSVTSPINNTGSAGPQDMRVLAPTSPSPAYAHAFLWMLPVEPGQGTTFGDSIGTAQSLNAHNDYNLTVIQPGYPINPWYADNPTDPTTLQETFTLNLVAWAKQHLATTGTEKHYLIGFSKSGLGGQGLQFRHPGVFQATASWDAPFMMTDYDGTDPDDPGGVGGGSAAVYGTSANFTSNYELSTGNLAGWKTAGSFGSVNRIWISGFSAFQSDVTDYDTLLTSAGFAHTLGTMASATHAWDTSWVAQALAAIMPVVHSVTASLTVTPTLAAGRRRGKFRSAAAAVSATFTALRRRGRFRSGSLTVTPARSATGTASGGGAHHTATAALTVTPARTVARTHGHAAIGHLTVSPAFVTGRTVAHHRLGSLSLHPAFGVTVTGGTQPVTQQPTGSWYQLLDVWKQAEEEFDWWADNAPYACPNDGEPLTNAPPTDAGSSVDRYCRFCGFQFPRDWVRPQRL